MSHTLQHDHEYRLVHLRNKLSVLLVQMASFATVGADFNLLLGATDQKAVLREFDRCAARIGGAGGGGRPGPGRPFVLSRPAARQGRVPPGPRGLPLP